MKDKDMAKAYCMHWFQGDCVAGREDAPCDPDHCTWFKSVVRKCHTLDIQSNSKEKRRA